MDEVKGWNPHAHIHNLGSNHKAHSTQRFVVLPFRPAGRHLAPIQFSVLGDPSLEEMGLEGEFLVFFVSLCTRHIQC